MVHIPRFANVIQKYYLNSENVLFTKTMKTFQVIDSNLIIVPFSFPSLKLQVFLRKYPNTMKMFFKATEKDLFKGRKRNSLESNVKLLINYEKLGLGQNEQ